MHVPDLNQLVVEDIMGFCDNVAHEDEWIRRRLHDVRQSFRLQLPIYPVLFLSIVGNNHIHLLAVHVQRGVNSTGELSGRGGKQVMR